MALTFPNPASGLTDLPEALCAADQYATSQIFEAIAGNAALGATKIEVFYSDYVDGDTIALPVSTVDDYIYGRQELVYAWCLRYGFQPATGTPSYKGAELFDSTRVDPDTGLVHVSKGYYVQGGEQHDSNDGLLAVWTIAVRGRTLVELASPGIVQSAYAWGMGDNCIPHLANPPAPGNTLLAICFCQDAGSGPLVGSTGFTPLTSYGTGPMVWVGARTVQPGDGQDWTFTFTGSYGADLYALLFEIAGSATPVAASGLGSVLSGNRVATGGIAAGSSALSFAALVVPYELPSSWQPGAFNQWWSSRSCWLASCAGSMSGSLIAQYPGAPAVAPLYATVVFGGAGISGISYGPGSLLRLAAEPGVYDQPSGPWNTDAPLRDDYLTTLLSGSKYSCVDVEVSSGAYTHGAVVPLPVSPVDGYTYTRPELTYLTCWMYTGKPNWGPTTGPGRVKRKIKSVDPSTGAVTSEIDYYDGSTTVTHDGIVLVIVIAQRARTYVNSFAPEAAAWNDIDDSAWLTGAALTTDDYHGLTKNVRFATERIEIWAAEYHDGDTVPLPTGRNDGYAYTRAELMYLFSGDDSGAFSGAALLNETISVDPSSGIVTYQVTGNEDGGGTGLSTSPALLVVTFAARQQEVEVLSATPVDNIPADQHVDGTSLANQALADLTAITVNGT